MSSLEQSLDPSRVERILDRLIEQSDGGAIGWESGAPPDAYAADIGPFRLRLRSAQGDGQSPFLFEMVGNNVNLVMSTGSQSPSLDQKIEALYRRGRDAVLDPNRTLRPIEQQLGLDSF